MDLIRYPYETDMYFYSNSNKKTKVRWYFVQEGAKILPFWHRFSSGVWEQQDKEQWEGVGEVPGARLRFHKDLPLHPQPGVAPDGTPEMFAEGVTFPSNLPIPLCVLANLGREIGGSHTPVSCATDCPEAVLANPVWEMGPFAPIGSLTPAILVHTHDCTWENRCFAGAPGCQDGTAAVWYVSQNAGDLTPQLIIGKDTGEISSCCPLLREV